MLPDRLFDPGVFELVACGFLVGYVLAAGSVGLWVWDAMRERRQAAVDAKDRELRLADIEIERLRAQRDAAVRFGVA